jgi:hypothetical protein
VGRTVCRSWKPSRRRTSSCSSCKDPTQRR